MLISNGDIGIDGRRGILRNAMPMGNNHGCLEQINGKWYVFYHRHTDGRDTSRQAAAEPIEMLPDGSFVQARLSSSGLLGRPLPGTGSYSARLASRLTNRRGGNTFSIFRHRFFPYLTQEETTDGPRQYVANLGNRCTVGFRSFAELGDSVKVETRSTGRGQLIVTNESDQVLGAIPIGRSRMWHTSGSAHLSTPTDGGPATLHFTYRGSGRLEFRSFELTDLGTRQSR